MDSGINIYVNNKPQQLHAEAKIRDLLDAINIPSQKGIALAVNNYVIPRTEWDTYALAPEDKVTLIKATQGG